MADKKRYEVINEMKDLLKFMDKKDIHEKELENFPPEKQKEIYDFLTKELEEIFSFKVTINQIKNDPGTAYGSLHS